ncbi:MAG: hypothetical protein WBA43_23875 [Elainellaceae cyanobacterium]
MRPRPERDRPCPATREFNNDPSASSFILSWSKDGDGLQQAIALVLQRLCEDAAKTL